MTALLLIGLLLGVGLAGYLLLVLLRPERF
jgi:K+-transporting ATPase KdpF subunit